MSSEPLFEGKPVVRFDRETDRRSFLRWAGLVGSRDKFLTTSHTFENVGVGAYLGAAGFIKNKDVLAAAASIFGVEARHAALVGNLLGLAPEGGVYMGAFETPQTKAKVLAAVTPFRRRRTGTARAGMSTACAVAAPQQPPHQELCTPQAPRRGQVTR